MKWKCTKCRLMLDVNLEQFPINHCGVSHEFPMGALNAPPGIIRRGVNFAAAGISHILSGRQLVDDGTRQWRLGQCLTCEKYYDPENQTCTHPRCGCGIKKHRGIVDKLGWASQRCPIGRWNDPPRQIQFVTNASLARDTIKFSSQLPKELCAVAGIPRSGMIPAALLATHLHLPLFSLHNDGFVPVGCGYRLSDSNHLNRPGPVLVIDDTSMYGGAMKRARANWQKFGPREKQPIFATIYCSEPELHRHGPLPDMWAVNLPSPHFLEWCLFNCGYVNRMAFDLDGILTVDGTVNPQYLPRKFELPLIVTGRLEAERARTTAWLAAHGVRYRSLVMFPGTMQQREKPGAIAAYKAEHWARSGLHFFCESDPEQAEAICKSVGKPVICPAIAKVFS